MMLSVVPFVVMILVALYTRPIAAVFAWHVVWPRQKSDVDQVIDTSSRLKTVSVPGWHVPSSAPFHAGLGDV